MCGVPRLQLARVVLAAHVREAAGVGASHFSHFVQLAPTRSPENAEFGNHLREFILWAAQGAANSLAWAFPLRCCSAESDSVYAHRLVIVEF